jgi:tryptophan synthase alpha chain
VAEASRGFVYAVSRGITGEKDSLSADAGPLVNRLKGLATLPVVLGFGISTPEQVTSAAAVADGVVVGSALVRFVEEHPEGDVAGYVRWLRSGL